MTKKLTKKKKDEIILTGAVKCGYIKQTSEGKAAIAIIGSTEEYKILGNTIINELLEWQKN